MTDWWKKQDGFWASEMADFSGKFLAGYCHKI
jgi:hypothetical protein